MVVSLVSGHVAAPAFATTAAEVWTGDESRIHRSARDLSPMRMSRTRMAPSTVRHTNDLPWIAVVRYGAPRHTRRWTESEIAESGALGRDALDGHSSLRLGRPDRIVAGVASGNGSSFACLDIVRITLCRIVQEPL